ncbi:MAG: hypothetical protein HC912_03795 [Saprospiraceae bacterium]|nr:hypothetical protein [Saprospiraceae bacterium]
MKQLILQYPYNANLRYLLVKKSQLENRGDHERNLRNAAVHSPDRERLFEWLKEETVEEERLELKQLNEISFFAPASPKEEIILEVEVAKKWEKTSPSVLTINDLEEEITTSNNKADQESKLTFPTQEIAQASENTIPEPQTEQESSEPLHRSNFRSWQQRYTQPRVSPLTTPPTKEEEAAQLAENSLTASKEVASETLAHLLVHQNQHEEAIKVYQRLALLFPEKK